MTLDKCQNTLVQIGTRPVSFILEHTTHLTRHSHLNHGVPSWCTFTKCRYMSTEEEKVCFRNAPANCTTLLPVYSNC